ncbi:MAG TPA: hypothetical protein VNV41_04395 [Candidatus Acidoferrales bacterium]|jgi:hypothetical protein|nr:hypothetical protein [Candidatus Acidoferrales bacterium]
MADDKRWSRADRIGFVGLIIAVIGVVTALLFPEVRVWLHLQNPDTPPQVTVDVPQQPPPTVIVKPPPTKAYVDFDHADINWDQKSSTLQANIYFSNYTPQFAPNTSANALVYLVPAQGGIPTKKTEEKYFRSFEEEAKNEVMHSTLSPQWSLWGSIFLPNFNQESVDQINALNKVVLIVGLVRFSDDAGNHRKDVCRWMQAPFVETKNPTFHLCEVHNELVK